MTILKHTNLWNKVKNHTSKSRSTHLSPWPQPEHLTQQKKLNLNDAIVATYSRISLAIHFNTPPTSQHPTTYWLKRWKQSPFLSQVRNLSCHCVIVICPHSSNPPLHFQFFFFLKSSPPKTTTRSPVVLIIMTSFPLLCTFASLSVQKI